MRHDSDEIRAWFSGRIPDDWFVEAPEVRVDRDEIIVIGRLPEPAVEEGTSPESRATARRARIQGWREDSRPQRVRIARQAERAFGRTVSWGARCGDEEELFSHLAAPTMTRLKMPEREVLDTLIAAGVARSRSEALAWCVRLVGQHTADWLEELRQALEQVNRVRHQGPAA